jgi:hypothetical protein
VDKKQALFGISLANGGKGGEDPAGKIFLKKREPFSLLCVKGTGAAKRAAPRLREHKEKRMMKKVISVLLAGAMALSLTACGSKDSGEAEKTFSADLTAFYGTLFQGDDAPMMMAVEDDETLEYLYPGLTAIEREQTVVYTAAISAVAAEVAMVEVASADVEAVQTIFQARIDAQVDGGAWYPETMENWENNSQIVTEGNYVCLFVGDDVADMASAFQALGQ